eukprot:SM000042S15379  [mRNA]  locus=s42:599324:603053:- [translate_table: standard]
MDFDRRMRVATALLTAAAAAALLASDFGGRQHALAPLQNFLYDTLFSPTEQELAEVRRRQQPSRRQGPAGGGLAHRRTRGADLVFCRRGGEVACDTLPHILPFMHAAVLPRLVTWAAAEVPSPPHRAVRLRRTESPDKRAASLQSWLAGLGHDACNLHLVYSTSKKDGPLGFAGYGCIAGPGGVQKLDVVVDVPRAAFMSIETANACPSIGPAIRQANMSPWQALCFHLLYERSLGHGSFWHPYIDALPCEEELQHKHPLMWPLDLQETLLQGTQLLGTVHRRLMQCKGDWDAIRSAAGCANLDLTYSNKFLTKEGVCWAAAILLSRSFSLYLGNCEDEETLTLVPWADMLNHSSVAGRESCLTYNDTSRSATLRAHRSYRAEEQVFDSYGPHLSAGQLFLDYGFALSNQSNTAVDFMAVDLGPPAAESNVSLLAAASFPIGVTLTTSESAVFALLPSGVSLEVMAWTRALLASEAELQQLGWGRGRSATSCLARCVSRISSQNEVQVLERLLKTFESKLARYPAIQSPDGKATLASPEYASAQQHALQAVAQEMATVRKAQLALQRTWRTLAN